MNKSNKAKLKKMVYRYWRKPTTKGYNRKGYSRTKAISTFKKTGEFKTVAGGSGHAAGYNWAKAKGISHEDPTRRYSKNSPSFDEGVFKYKDEQKQKLLSMVKRMKKIAE